MSWQVDREPIDYLRRRVKYYKGRMSKVKNLIKEQWMVEKYGEEELRYIIARRLLSIESFISMYEKAVKDLQTIEEIEDNP
jgi:hypothetical protein